MTDVFISYQHRDREAAAHVANALAREGLQVWWDQDLQAGDHWDQMIEQQLEIAKCVIVIWSRNSLQSNFVKAEAQKGFTRNILVGAMLEQVELPAPFNVVQAADIRTRPGMREILDAAQRMVRRANPTMRAGVGTPIHSPIPAAPVRPQPEQGGERPARQPVMAPPLAPRYSPGAGYVPLRPAAAGSAGLSPIHGQSKSDTGSANLIYILYLVSLLTFVPLLIGLIIAYVELGNASTYLRTHYLNQINIFWKSVVFMLVGGSLLFAFGIGALILLFGFIWFIVRTVKGLQALNRRAAIERPGTWSI